MNGKIYEAYRPRPSLSAEPEKRSGGGAACRGGKGGNPMGAVMLWNKDREESVMSTKLRSIGIYFSGSGSHGCYSVRGWFNANESFYFGAFDSKSEAEVFVEALHAQIERRTR
jgi:hypothetical protein